MASFSLQLQDSQGQEPQECKQGSVWASDTLYAWRKNKQAFVKGRPTMTPQERELKARREPGQGQKAGVVSATPAGCDLTCSPPAEAAWQQKQSPKHGVAAHGEWS